MTKLLALTFALLVGCGPAFTLADPPADTGNDSGPVLAETTTPDAGGFTGATITPPLVLDAGFTTPDVVTEVDAGSTPEVDAGSTSEVDAGETDAHLPTVCCAVVTGPALNVFGDPNYNCTVNGMHYICTNEDCSLPLCK